MKTKIMICTMVFLLSAFTGSAFGEMEGIYNTYFGNGAGANTLPDNVFYDTFIGAWAGTSNTSGQYNTYVGYNAGATNSTGVSNTFVGYAAGQNGNGSGNTLVGSQAGLNCWGNRNTMVGEFAGSNNHGWYNVFIGWNAAASEEASNRLYIANSGTTTPLIYGEFDNNKLTINGNLEAIGPDNGLVRLSNVTTDNTTKVSRMVLRHYSNAQLPVYLFGAASTATDNFVAFGGGNTIGNAATQIDFFTAPNTTTPVGIPRLTIIDNGNVGIGTQTPSHPFQMAGGAYSDGFDWYPGSSREYKDNIQSLDTQEALEALASLDPVKFNYKGDASQKHIGFIAEEVPELVATKDRKGLSPMDIVAVLTKVVQELKARNEMLEERLLKLEGKVK